MLSEESERKVKKNQIVRTKLTSQHNKDETWITPQTKNEKRKKKIELRRWKTKAEMKWACLIICYFMSQSAVSDGFAWKSAAWKSCRMANNFPSVQNEVFVGWKKIMFLFLLFVLLAVVVDKMKAARKKIWCSTWDTMKLNEWRGKSVRVKFPFLWFSWHEFRWM